MSPKLWKRLRDVHLCTRLCTVDGIIVECRTCQSHNLDTEYTVWKSTVWRDTAKKLLTMHKHLFLVPTHSFIHSFIHSGYFYSASSSPLLLRGSPNYSTDAVSELTRRSATGNYEWRTCPRPLRAIVSQASRCLKSLKEYLAIYITLHYKGSWWNRQQNL